MLRMLGCDYAQGYFISPPLPAEKLQGVVAHIAVGSAGSEPAASAGPPRQWKSDGSGRSWLPMGRLRRVPAKYRP
jgi:predicted signal transduction protein with EAL and GGDEF domain